MSVITDVEGTPGRLVGLWGLLRMRGQEGFSEQDVLALISPPPLRRGEADRAATARGLITAAIELGIVSRADGRLVAIKAEHVSSEDELRDYLAKRLTSDMAEGTTQATFPRALAWFLEQSPTTPYRFGSSATDDSKRFPGLVTETLPQQTGAFELTSDASWQQFVYWAMFLGFAWRLGIRASATNQPVGKGGGDWIIPDPTTALERELRAQVGGRIGASFHLRDLLRDLGRRCTVLEGGAIRTEIARRMGRGERAELTQISASTSLALVQLHERGLIKLDRRDDGDPLTLEGQRDPRWARVSHLVVGERL